METPDFAVLRTFRGLFERTRYKHRDSSLGDFVASHLYEDLVMLNKSETLTQRVLAHECVVNLANKTVGKPSRRGDGTFGELVPTVAALTERSLHVARGEIANIQVGTETKILAKAMIKQIDRVIRTSPARRSISAQLVATRFASRSSASISPSIARLTKANANGRRMARNTNIRFRKQNKRNAGYETAHCRTLMSFSFCASARPMFRRFRSNGWILR